MVVEKSARTYVDSEGTVEEVVTQGGNGHTEPAEAFATKRIREYIPFIIGDEGELQSLARYTQEHLPEHLRTPTEQDEGDLELRVQRSPNVVTVPNVLSVIEFWEQHPLEVPAVVVDKRHPDLPGAMFKLFHSEVDPRMFTAVINPYTIRTSEGISPVETIDPEQFVITLATELKEMRPHRSTLLDGLSEKERAVVEKGLVDAIHTYLPRYQQYLVEGRTAPSEKTKPGIAPELVSSELRLTAVIKTLNEHFGRRDMVSRHKVSLATDLLYSLLTELPPGITYVTLSEKEGVFIPTDALNSKTQAGKPAYAVKRFKTIQQARYVHNLSEWLRNDRETKQKEEGLVHLQTPQTYWPSKVNGFSVVLMDTIPGETLLDLFPRLKGFEEADSLKHNVNLVALDNIVHWQSVSPEAARELSGYQMQPHQIQTFTKRAVTNSSETLGTVTDAALKEEGKNLILIAGGELALLINENPALGLDSGVKNIIRRRTDQLTALDEFIAALSDPSYKASQPIRGSAVGVPAIADSLWHVDLPYEWGTVHEFRDPVRLLLAPANNLDWQRISNYAAYFILRSEYLRATDTDKAKIEQQIDLLIRNVATPESLPVVAHRLEKGPYDLYVAAVAEAARMTVVIPRIFLSKIVAAMNGSIPTRMSQGELKAKFDELVGENQQWAQVGLSGTYELGKRLESSVSQKVVPGLELLFTTWVKAAVNPEKLPPYQPFMRV